LTDDRSSNLDTPSQASGDAGHRSDSAEGSSASVSAFGPVEPPPEAETPKLLPLDDEQLGQAITRGSKLDADDESEEIYPPALKLGGSAWVPSTYWSADYRLRLGGDAARDLQDQRPLRDREDTQAAERSDLMLETVFFALDDPAELS
jgi:hypothetical protein